MRRLTGKFHAVALALLSALLAGCGGRRAERIDWVPIPGGTFLMGSEHGALAEAPAHRVTVKTFQMARTLVTNRQYAACVRAGACTPRELYGPAFDGADQPVLGVDWQQAKAFCAWAGGRLPSEAEWEYAARSAGKDQNYPWGDEEPTCERAVIEGCAPAPARVCSRPAGSTAQGLCDMAGGVWEWLQDTYQPTYAGAPADGGAWETDPALPRVGRGGSWHNDAFAARARYRSWDRSRNLGNDFGFRPARSR